MEDKKIAEMYGVLLLIKEAHKKYNVQEPFDTYSKRRVENLFKQAYERIVEDERESNEKVAQD